MRVRHSKLLALIGAGILAVTALVACGNGDAATAQPAAVETSRKHCGREQRSSTC